MVKKFRQGLQDYQDFSLHNLANLVNPVHFLDIDTEKRMPIYEYRCNECGQRFEKLIRSLNQPPEIICPQCHSRQVQRLISAPAVHIGGEGGGATEPVETTPDRPAVFGRKELQAAQEKRATLRDQVRYGDD
jgi:putative FmdB family regulatory protein